MYKINIILILFCIIPVNNIFSQVNQEWVQRYSSSGAINDVSNDIAIDKEGNIYITGGGSAITTIKYNSSGIEQWKRFYYGTENIDASGYAIVLDSIGNVYVTGYAYNTGRYEDFVTIKYNNNGDSLWVAVYDAPPHNSDIAQDIAVDTDGNVYVTGEVYNFISGEDALTIKYDSSGNVQWMSEYKGLVDSAFAIQFSFSIALDDSANVYISGSSNDTMFGPPFNLYTIKYNNSGEQQWVNYYNASNSFAVYTKNIVDEAGNSYVGGTLTDSNFKSDIIILKYNSAGNQEWSNVYNSAVNGNDFFSSITPDGFGNLYVSGYNDDFLTIKYNTSGSFLWDRTYNGPGNGYDRTYSIGVDTIGNTYVTGEVFNVSNTDYATVKYSTLGNQEWVTIYNGKGNGDDKALAIFIDSELNVCITGVSFGGTSADDLTTIKYSQLVGAEPVQISIPNSLHLYQNYPNPFNPVTKIKFDIPNRSHKSKTKLSIYDISGKKIATLLNQDISAGSYEIDWDATDHASGVYYYTLEAGQFKETKKMLLLK